MWFPTNKTFIFRFIIKVIYVFHTKFKYNSWNIKVNDLPRLKYGLDFAWDSKLCLFWAKMATKWSKNGQKYFLLVQLIAPSWRCISYWKNVTLFFKINAILWELWVFSNSGSNQLPIGWSVAFSKLREVFIKPSIVSVYSALCSRVQETPPYSFF